MSGEARLYFASNTFLRSLSRLTTPGELIGLSETLAQISYKATLRALSRCECLIIAREELIAMLLQDRDLRDSLLFDLAKKAITALETAVESRVTFVTYPDLSERI